MSFFRPEATRVVARWAETAIIATVMVGMVSFILSWSGTTAPVRWSMAAVVGLGCLWVLRSAVLSALADRGADAPGVVTIDERRVSYFGPHIGGVIAIDDIQEIEIATPAPAYWQYEAQWVLRWSNEEAALIIPVSAKGADGLVDAFSALPRFAPTRAFAALAAGDDQTVTIWRRDGAASGPALAHVIARD